MAVSNQLRNQHIMWRAGFGPTADQLHVMATTSQKSLFKSLLEGSTKPPAYIEVADNALKEMMMGMNEQEKMKKSDLSADEKKQLIKQSQHDIRALNLSWLNEMAQSDAQLREKMSFFWHGHFATRSPNIFYQQQLLDIIRRNALGNFRDLLHEVSKSAVMINFLNSNQNKKGHPNENFAREVMELFTMGRGNYTETDIKEAARAFTGWGANMQGEFVFRKFQHDGGTKTILGKTGNYDGDDVLDILLDKKETAHFISKKLYRFLVNDKADDEKAIWLGNRFYQSNYDIKSLLEDVFTSDWFYEEKNIGAKIKSPIELIAGIRRLLPMKIENEEVQLTVQAVLGQLLFFPPNVAGWPGGANWIDSSSLMFRLRIPQIIYASDEFDMKPKDDDDVAMGRSELNENAFKVKGLGKTRGGQMLKAEIFWAGYLKKFELIQKEDLLAEISKTVLQTSSGISAIALKKYIDQTGRDSFIKTATIELMSTPEYQLC
ncbi:MAG: DUF1800 domain-containing protein [Bacteroidetes bacterium]|nr:DUF1800 domain-containing protein [Bacteroidota bacterium]MBS1973103.1 DUF1800 domain-containing protein [Bacteroidota bacterium]